MQTKIPFHLLLMSLVITSRQTFYLHSYSVVRATKICLEIDAISIIARRFRHNTNGGRVSREKKHITPTPSGYPAANVPWRRHQRNELFVAGIRDRRCELPVRRIHTGRTTPRHPSLAEIKTATTRSSSRLAGQ